MLGEFLSDPVSAFGDLSKFETARGSIPAINPIRSMKMKRFVFYPGHLGESPHTELPGRRGILWNRAHPVRLVEEPHASSLIRDSGFLPAYTIKNAAQKLGCTMKQVRQLVGDGTLAQALYQTEKDKPVEVVILGLEDRSRARSILGGKSDG